MLDQPSGGREHFRSSLFPEARRAESTGGTGSLPRAPELPQVGRGGGGSAMIGILFAGLNAREKSILWTRSTEEIVGWLLYPCPDRHTIRNDKDH